MPRFHRPNPLDALFLAIDEAWRRCGLWSADIHLYLEMGGHVDMDGLRRAVCAVHRLYPPTASRLARPALARTPAWRLDGPRPEADDVVSLKTIDPPTHDNLLRHLDELLAVRIDLARQPPLRIHVLRGRPAGDVIVLRWPHALMDARGGETIIREIARLHENNTDPADVESAGDESRTDFGTLGDQPTLPKAIRSMLRGDDLGAAPANWQDIRLSDATTCTGDERQRVFVRRFSPEEFAELRTAAARVCGFARVGDFIRACAVRALHETVDGSHPSGSGYSTLHLLENRRRRDPGPVCHNVFTTMPLFVPASIATDRRAVGDLMQETAARMIEPDVMRRRLAGIRLLSLLGTNTLARELARGLQTGKSRLPIGLAGAPSLPMGFMNLFSKPLGSFCGAEFLNLFGLRAASPIAGLGVNVCTVNDRLNISGVHVEPHVSRGTIDRFLDLFVRYLTDADS